MLLLAVKEEVIVLESDILGDDDEPKDLDIVAESEIVGVADLLRLIVLENEGEEVSEAEIVIDGLIEALTEKDPVIEELVLTLADKEVVCEIETDSELAPVEAVELEPVELKLSEVEEVAEWFALKESVAVAEEESDIPDELLTELFKLLLFVAELESELLTEKVGVLETESVIEIEELIELLIVLESD